MSQQHPISRFQLENDSAAGGSKKFSRSEFDPSPEGREPLTFLGKLTAMFGRPKLIDGGFEYALRDVERNCSFTAYSGPSGPSYGASLDLTPERLRPSILAFEAELAKVRAADCAVEVTEEIEFGGEAVRIGLRDGKPFRERLKKKDKAPSARSAKTYEDCLAVAKAQGGPYGIEAGWQRCIDKALPRVPASFEIGARHYENCVGFAFSEHDQRPVYLFDEGPGLEEIPVEAIPWATRLSSTADLWLTSYATWLGTVRRKKNNT